MKRLLKKIKTEIHRLDPSLDEDDPSFKIAVILLMSLHVGPNIKRLAKFVKSPRSFVAEVSRLARKNKIWKGGKIYCDWGNKKTGGIAFWLDVAVCQGWLTTV